MRQQGPRRTLIPMATLTRGPTFLHMSHMSHMWQRLSLGFSLVLAIALWPLGAITASAPAAAHQQKEAITRVSFNARTDTIEVMHRFLLHDAEHASREILGKATDLWSNAQDRDRFEAYVHEGFELLDQNDRPIALTPVGNEIESEFLWVYAEAPIPPNLTSLTISHRALRDVWPDHINLVNVERDRKVRSALFGPGSEAITVELN